MQDGMQLYPIWGNTLLPVESVEKSYPGDGNELARLDFPVNWAPESRIEYFAYVANLSFEAAALRTIGMRGLYNHRATVIVGHYNVVVLIRFSFHDR